ncbi:hypothetical protein GCM10007079_39620 [Nocardiopsis terrae]|nr:hypothetical protein GCM10007079_39620 [Nocardiopsis terrae]
MQTQGNTFLPLSQTYGNKGLHRVGSWGRSGWPKRCGGVPDPVAAVTTGGW